MNLILSKISFSINKVQQHFFQHFDWKLLPQCFSKEIVSLASRLSSGLQAFFSTLFTVKIGKTNSALPAVFAHSHSAPHKARFNHFFLQVGLVFCFDKINYRSRLFLSFSLLAAFISRLPRVSMRVSAPKNASPLLLLLLRSPGFSRRPAGWQLPHHIAWRLKGPHTHTPCPPCQGNSSSWLFWRVRLFAAPGLFSPAVFTLEDFQTNFKHECKICRVLLDNENVPFLCSRSKLHNTHICMCGGLGSLSVILFTHNVEKFVSGPS